MAYLGRTELKSSDIRLKASTTISGSSTNTVVLTWTAPTEQSIILKVNGVVQHTDAYSIAGSPTTITLASGNFADGATVEVVGINDIGTTIVPADGSVTRTKLATTGTPTGAKFLQDDMAWTTVDSLPSQTSQSGKFLTTDGSAASWATVGGFGASELKGFARRPIFEWLTTTTMGLQGDFVYQHNGTTTQMVSGANVTFTRSDTSGTEQWNYLYLDDSAIVTAGDATITASQLISSPTAPTLNTTKGGFYNGNDRCIYAWKQNASDEILRFSKIQQLGAGVGTVLNNFSWTFESSSGSAYGTGWHSYTATTDYLPRPCGPGGLCMGAYVSLGGSHAHMFISDDIGTEYDMFEVNSPWLVNAPVSSAGVFKTRLNTAHSAYSQTFKLIGWVMNPLL